ncbi:UbiX family flavin prenyltransferase [Sulfurovum sp. CS9]|uniref:UbiX family flavin prenyltransferase n=1 Tax=Sulfurovum sp. CS9 TaxID=3391146 RepID=UPI0039ECBEDD
MKLVIAITGASGVHLGKKFVDYLPEHIEAHVVVSDNAITVESFENKKVTLHSSENIAASISSGSFRVDATAIIPCSMNTLAKVACGISDNLATRVAAVALKEQKKLLLAPRELPFSAIALENMQKLAALGVIIAPPVMGYYSESSSLEEMEKFIIGKWYDVLGIENSLYERWEGESVER